MPELNPHGLVLALFGSTAEAGVRQVLALQSVVARAFVQTTVRLAFSSQKVRQSWHQRAKDPHYCNQHPDIPDEIFNITDVSAALASLYHQGCHRLIVQPVQVCPAQEFHAIAAAVRTFPLLLEEEKDFSPILALGRPLLGGGSLLHPYVEDIRAVARALAADAEQARYHQAALVYMGHGNRFFPAGGYYLEFAACMRQLYPGVVTLIAAMEGFPALPEVLAELQQRSISRVMLKPLLITAGVHARRDLFGTGGNSWQSIFAQAGFSVIPVSRGLLEHQEIVQLFVQHAAQAGQDAGIFMPGQSER